MRTAVKMLIVAGLLALSAAPAYAANPHEGSPPYGHGPSYVPGEEEGPPGPGAGLPEKAKAYGRYCQGKSKKHVKGEKGTEFSRCVTTMAKVATDDDLTPKQACKGESKKHVKGEKGTAFSRCVKDAARLRHDEHASEV
jgi:hypothetical protein